MAIDNDVLLMTPDLQASVLCDDIRQENNGKFIIIGLFDHLVMPEFPALCQKLCIVTRWCSGAGEFTQTTRIICPDGVTKLVEGRQVPVKLQSEVAIATSVEIFMNLKFPQDGNYWVEIFLNNKLEVRYPLTVVKRKQP